VTISCESYGDTADHQSRPPLDRVPETAVSPPFNSDRRNMLLMSYLLHGHVKEVLHGCVY